MEWESDQSLFVLPQLAGKSSDLAVSHSHTVPLNLPFCHRRRDEKELIITNLNLKSSSYNVSIYRMLVGPLDA